MEHKHFPKKSSKLIRIIDSTSFVTIFIIWIALIVIFALMYNLTYLTTNQNHLSTIAGDKIVSVADYIYFSFITATSTGYGDITPKGLGMRGLAVFNVVIGMIMMAIVTSKLVSMKQEKLLEHIYYLSSTEKINRMISGLDVFRVDAENLIADIKEKSLDRRTLFTYKMSVSALKHNIAEINQAFVNKHHFTKDAENMVTHILSRLSQVYEKLLEATELMHKHDISFKNPALIEDVYTTTNIGEQLTNKIKKEFPSFTAKADEVLSYVVNIKSKLMSLKIIDPKRELEINISPDIFYAE